MRWEVYAQDGIHWQGLKEPLKLAWVKEKHLKGKYKGQTLTFWVITTDESLTAEELREIAHDRWAIETNGFKELNEQVGSKKRYIKNLKVKEALVLIWGLGMSLLKAYQCFLETQEEWIRWGVRKTKKLLAQEIIASLILASALGGETGDELDHTAPRPIAPPHRRHRKIGGEESDHVQAALEVTIELHELSGEPAAKFLAD